ncbi:zinc-ribbon domain-containing protein [Clostridium sp. MCC353]|uniref:zinc-ribbon domain-containing protein n=1 Tax=Clostridium sp. MCC353 TaxID=2592646 RepID=UPI001C022097|nr:zinc-ribbon domain-containing protein [Clostridium sp. MCC353]
MENKQEHLLKEWDYIRNKGMTPDNIRYTCCKRACWIRYEERFGKMWELRWETSVWNRTQNKSGCPYLTRPVKKLLSGFNDFQSMHPRLAAEWDDRKNSLSANQVPSGTQKKYWWKMTVEREGKEYELSWQASVQGRVRGSGCPYLSGFAIYPGFNDLKSTHPRLAAEYMERNEERAEEISFGCNRKKWWKCSRCGHEWRCTPNARTNLKSGCPKCHEYASTSFCEQAVLFYMKKAFPGKKIVNRDVSLGYEIDVLIYDINGKMLGIEYSGEWAHAAAKKKELDKKKRQQAKKDEILLFGLTEDSSLAEISVCGREIRFPAKKKSNLHMNDVLPVLFREVGQTLNLELRCEVSVEKDEYAVREQWSQALYEKSFGTRFPQLAEQFDKEHNGNLSPYGFLPFSAVEAVWCHTTQAGIIHTWKASFAKRASGEGCPFCAGKRILAGDNDFESLEPELLACWDFEKNRRHPSELTRYSHEPACWFHVVNGVRHEWEASLNTMVSNRNIRKGGSSGCPVCSGKVIISGINDLATTHKELLGEWDYGRNEKLSIFPDKISYGYDKRVFWIHTVLKDGKEFVHQWAASPNSRTNSHSGCPYCKNKAVLKGFNDLETIYPQIAGKWDHSKNQNGPDSYTPGSSKSVYWTDRPHAVKISDRTKYLRKVPFPPKLPALASPIR